MRLFFPQFRRTIGGMKWFPVRTVMYVAVALVSVVLTGCLEIATEIHLNADGSGYVISQHRLAAELSVYSDIDNASGQVLAPLEREYIEDYLYRIDGAELSDYRLDTNDDYHKISVRIAFDDTVALSAVLEQQGMQLTMFDMDTGLDLVLVPGADELIPNEPFLQDIARSVSMDIAVYAPYQLVSAEPEKAVVDGKSVNYNLPLQETVISSQPLILRLRW